MTLAAVLFDMDGLLVDSEPLWSVAEAEVMDWLGGTWSLEVKAACIGQRMDESCRTLIALAGASVPVEAVIDRLHDRMVGLFRSDLPLLPGAAELIAALRAAAIPTALVSSTYRVLVDAVLEVVGRDVFDVSIAGDEVVDGKPAPEPYLRAAAALGVHPADCVVLEDSAAGIAAGEAAGCAVVAVPNVVPVSPGPDRLVVASLRDVSPASLAALVQMRDERDRAVV